MADNSQYSKSIQDFAKSLEGLMKAMVESIENQAANNPTETIKKLAQDIAASTEILESVKEDVKKTKTNSDEILEIVKSLQKEKRRGMFDRLTDKGKGKVSNVAEGIKTIALMAGAILAIGKAFQIIGTVDFPSVIALSVALPLMAMAFNEIGEKVRSPRESGLIAISMIAMSAGIAISGGILSYMPTLSIGQLITTIGVAAAIGVAMFGLSIVADKLNAKEVKSLYLIAPVMPLVATGIVASGMILQYVPQVDLQNTILTSLAVTGAVTIFALAAGIINKVAKPKDIALGSLSLVIASGALALSAQIIQNIPQVDLQKTIMSSLAVTGGAFIFGLGAALLNKVGNAKDVTLGSLSLVIASGGLALASQLIALGDYTNYPSLDWATGFGVSMLLTLPSILAFGFVATSGIGAVAIAAGVLSMIGVSAGLVAVSHILALGNYSAFPDVKWAVGVGASLLGFGIGSIALGAVMLTGIGAVALVAGIAAVAGIASSIVAVSNILHEGTYTDNYPSVVWAAGSAAAIAAFAVSMAVGGIASLAGKVFEFLGGDSPTDIAQKIVDVSHILSKGNFSKYPDPLWAAGAAATLAAFAGGSAVGSVASAIGNFASGILGGDTATDIAQKIVDVSRILNEGDYSTYPDLAWSTSVLNLLNGFSNVSGNFSEVTKDIDNLSFSYIKLAGAINLLATATNKVKDISNLTATKGTEFSKVMGLVNSANTTKIDDSSFAFNKDKVQTTSQNININSVNSTSASNTPVATTVIRPDTTRTEDKDNMVKLMQQIINLLSSNNGVLGEIADNTAIKMSNVGIIN